MNKEELIEKINEWTSEAGESFTDYFMHDNVKELSWAFWLLGKGFEEHALNIIRGIEKGQTYFDQEELFEIFPEYEGENEYGDPKYNDENYDKNVEVWAEFLVATDSYKERVNKFFAEN